MDKTKKTPQFDSKYSNYRIARAIVYSIVMLVVTTIGLGIFFLITSVVSNAQTKSETLLNTDMAWDGSWLPANVEIVRTKILAGQTKPIHQHNNLFCGVLQKGELTITKANGGDAAIFLPGDAFCEILDKDHFGTAGRRQDVEVLTFEVKNFR